MTYPTLPRRILTRLLPVALLAVGAAACDDDPVSPEDRVAEVQVTPAAWTIASLGGTVALTAVALDSEGEPVQDITFTWSSSDPAVATVDSDGGVTAVAEGQAEITAESGDFSNSATITVEQEIVQVVVTPDPATTTVGQTVQFTAQAFDLNGSAVADATFAWTSSVQTVATIDATGLATAQGAGTTDIEAAASGIVGTVTLEVTS